LGDKFLPDPAKMLTLILRLILDGEALFEIEETSKYVVNDNYVTMGTSKPVIEELTLAIKSLILKIPNERIFEWHEKLDELYRDCLKKDKIGVYIVFVSEFIHHPRFQADAFIDILLKNILPNIDSQDSDLLEKVIDCINSGSIVPPDADVIEENLYKEWQNSLVILIRREIEDKMGIDEDDETYDTDKLAILQAPKGVEVLVKICLNVLLTGKPDSRIDAAFCIGIIAKFADLKLYKKYVIKMAGGLIRIVNDKFEDELKREIFRALRRMFEKAGTAMKPMSAPLKTTFNQYSKQLSEISEDVKEELNKLQNVVNSAFAKK
jgi:hypothetical protein